MKKENFIWAAGLSAALALFLSACGGGDGEGTPDIGDNNAGVILAIGDSITDGGCIPAGAPYPSRVASITGKSVVNAGVCGQRSSGGASRINGLLAKHKPGAVMILYGANDIIHGADPAGIVQNLRGIVQAAKGNQSVVLIANLMPMYDDHGQFDGAVKVLNPMINAMAREEGVRLVNLAKEFGTRRELLQDDGLHPSDAGTQVLAFAFADRL